MVNPTGFPSFPWPEPGGKGGGDFLFKAPKGPLFGSPFPPLSRPQTVPAAADFLFATFSFGGAFSGEAEERRETSGKQDSAAMGAPGAYSG